MEFSQTVVWTLLPHHEDPASLLGGRIGLGLVSIAFEADLRTL
jgi:hypothetical protein